MTSTAVAACEIANVNYQHVGDKTVIVFVIISVVKCIKFDWHLSKCFNFIILPYLTPELSYSVVIWWLN